VSRRHEVGDEGAEEAEGGCDIVEAGEHPERAYFVP
jgi:hypothetical protein